MKRLKDIEKKDIFSVPDGYFDSLPTIIQSRVTAKNEGRNPFLIYSLKYALPVVMVAVGLFWYLNNEQSVSPEALLATVNPEDIAEYITTMEMSNDELLDILDYSQINADSLNFYESDIILDEIDLTDELLELETELRR